jgi:hypothetical protein
MDEKKEYLSHGDAFYAFVFEVKESLINYFPLHLPL